MTEPGVHRYDVRVYFEDTDAGGIVYYANYLRYAERARTEMLREAGIESSELMARDGIALAVRRCNVDYLRPARLDDMLQVETRVLDVGGASLEAEQVVMRGGKELVRMELKLGCLGADGRPARMPGSVRDRLKEIHAMKEQA